MFFQKEGLASISERSNEGSDASGVGRQAAVARGVNDIRVEARAVSSWCSGRPASKKHVFFSLRFWHWNATVLEFPENFHC